MGNPFSTPTLAAPPPAPTDQPDLTDQSVQDAAAAQRRRAALGTSMASTFLTGPLGVPSAPTNPAAPTAKGG